MTYKLTVHGLAANQGLLIDGVGLVKNGVYTVDDKLAARFKSAVAELHKESTKVPTLLEAFRNHPNVDVEVVHGIDAETVHKVPESHPVYETAEDVEALGQDSEPAPQEPNDNPSTPVVSDVQEAPVDEDKKKKGGDK